MLSIGSIINPPNCILFVLAGLDSDNVRANQPSKTVEPLINDQAAAHTGDLDDIVKNRIAIEQVDVPGKSQNGENGTHSDFNFETALTPTPRTLSRDKLLLEKNRI